MTPNKVKWFSRESCIKTKILFRTNCPTQKCSSKLRAFIQEPVSLGQWGAIKKFGLLLLLFFKVKTGFLTYRYVWNFAFGVLWSKFSEMVRLIVWLLVNLVDTRVSKSTFHTTRSLKYRYRTRSTYWRIYSYFFQSGIKNTYINYKFYSPRFITHFKL